MKKILAILTVTLLLASCACDNGEKCETTNTDTGHFDSTAVDVDSTVVTTVTE